MHIKRVPLVHDLETVEMERLREVMNALWQQLPICTACQVNVADGEVYCFLSCFHFICMQCVTKGVAACTLCAGGIILYVDMGQLAEGQRKLREGLQNFYGGQNYEYFSMTCDAFWNLLRVVKAGQSVNPQPNFRDPGLPTLSKKGEWTCPKCPQRLVYPADKRMCDSCKYVNLAAVETMLETWTCSCGTPNPELHTKCVGCGRDKAGPVPQQPVMPQMPSSVWTCGNCSYEYNNVNQHLVCQRCGTQKPQVEEQKVQRSAQQPAWSVSLPIKPPPAQPAGDYWRCQCGYAYNIQGMQVCGQCQRPYVRPDVARPKISNQPWTCALCKFTPNFRQDICSKCDQPRQEEIPPPYIPPNPQPQPPQHPSLPRNGQFQQPLNGQPQHPYNWDQMSKTQKRKWNKKNGKK